MLMLFTTSLFLLTAAGHSASNPSMSAATNSQSTVMYSALTATLTPPQTNASGWYNTTVFVHFAVTNYANLESSEDYQDVPGYKFDSRGPVKITRDLVLSNEMAESEFWGVAVDQNGITLSNVVLVQIDKTPPTVKMEAGNAGVFDDSYPLLVVNYSDALVNTNGRVSGIKLDTFAATLDGTAISNEFYRFNGRAVAFLKHLAAGPHLWVASIADEAGNLTTVSNSFTATGTINSHAPAIYDVDLDEVANVGERYELWVQGKVTGPKSTVTALVNDLELVRMNRRDDDFGYTLSIEPGTNIVILTAADATGQNRCAKLFKVVRSEYQAGVQRPPPKYYVKFTNGEPQPVTPVVSRYFDDGNSRLQLQSVKVNGIPAPLTNISNDLVICSTVILPAPGCTNSVVPIILSICWSGATSSNHRSTVCVNVPVDLIEGYEIVERQTSYTESWLAAKYPREEFESIPGCPSGKWIVDQADSTSEDQFALPCTGNDNATWNVTNSDWQRFCAVEAGFNVAASNATPPTATAQVTQPNRGLSFGKQAWRIHYTRHATGDGVAYVEAHQAVADGSLTIRTPFSFPPQYPDIFRFNGVTASGSLSNLMFEGNVPISINESNREVIYLLMLDGATEYTISRDSFEWIPTGTNTFTKHAADPGNPAGKHLESYSEESDFMHFADFGQ